jgi:hypothetical protein
LSRFKKPEDLQNALTGIFNQEVKKIEPVVPLFAKESTVSFINNRAERALRMVRLKQKVLVYVRKNFMQKFIAEFTSIPKPRIGKVAILWLL